MMYVRQASVVAGLLAKSSMGMALQTTLATYNVGMILPEIETLKSEGHDVCITLNTHYELGGLANTMGIVNTVLGFALEHGLGWVQPEIRPPAHQTGDAFRFMFGEPEWCMPRDIPLYIASCPFQLTIKGHHSSLPDGHCPMNETWLYPNTMYAFTHCETNCSVLVMVSSIIDWIFDYSQTAAFLSSMYLKRKNALDRNVSSDMQFPLSTVVHLRLGDVEGTGDMKEFNAEKFEAMQTGLTSMVDPRCLTVELHTDAMANDTAVQDAKKSWTSDGVATVKIFDITSTEVEAFERMTSASILIGGPSGFSRLAAVLGRAYVKLFVNDFSNSHPIEYLNGTTTITLDEEVTSYKVKQGLAANEKMTEVTKACKAWLGEN